MKKQFIIHYLIAFAAGCLITLALAPFDIWPLAIVSLALLHGLLSKTNRKQGIYISLLFGFGLLLSGAHWLFVSMHDHGGSPFLVALLLTGGFCFLIGSLLLPFTWLFKTHCNSSIWASSFGFAALWTLSEWFKTWFLTGFPWLFVGYSQTESVLAGWAPIIGTLGISFILAFTAAAISLSIQNKKNSLLLGVALLLWLPAPYLANIEWTEQSREKPYNVALVQGNIALKDKWDPAFKKPMMDYYLEQIENLPNTDIIVLPETAITEFYHRASDWFDAVDEQLKPKQSALITGIPNIGWDYLGNVHIYNALATAGAAQGIYNKHKLVPFGEFIPFEQELHGILDFFDIPMSSFSRGNANQAPLMAKDLWVQPYICYEVMYPDYVSNSAVGADLLLTVSNDSWFGKSIGPLQHLQMAQMRALETGRYLIRATNNGMTAIISPQGHITQSIPRFAEGILQGEVYAMQGLTPVMQYGTLPVVIFSFIIVIFFTLYSRLRNKPS